MCAWPAGTIELKASGSSLDDTYDLLRRVCDLLGGSVGGDCYLDRNSLRCAAGPACAALERVRGT